MNAISPAAHPTAHPTATGKFAIRNLSILAYANGFSLWHYKSARGNLADISAAHYFDDAADMLSLGDMIMVCGADGGTVLTVCACDLYNVATGALK